MRRPVALLVCALVALGGCSGDPAPQAGETTPPPARSPRAGEPATTPADSPATTPGTQETAWACASHDPLDLADVAVDGRIDEVRTLMRECVPSPEASEHDDVALARAANVAATPVVDYLLEAGADPAYVDTTGTSVLHWTARWVHAEADPDAGTDAAKAEIVRLLLDGGADVDLRGEGEHTPLHWAAFAGYEQVTAALVAAGADVDATNDAGATPLLLAAGPGRLPVVEVLLEAGADPSIRDERDLTAAEVAARQGHDAVARVIEERG